MKHTTISFSQRESRLQRENNITTKSTKDTTGNQIEKNFVIFVYFVVAKIYNVLQDPRLPLRASS